MKANRIPQTVRLKNRIGALAMRYERSRESTNDGNPYVRCKGCDIRDPELSIRDGRHYRNCQYAGILKEISHYRELLVNLETGKV